MRTRRRAPAPMQWRGEAKRCMLPTPATTTGPRSTWGGPTADQLYVVNAKGLGTGPNAENGPNPYQSSTPADQYVGSMAVGSLSLIAVPDQLALDAFTQQVVANNGFDKTGMSLTAGQVI